MWYGYRYTRWSPSRAPSSYPPPPIPLPAPRSPPNDQQPTPLPSAPPYSPIPSSSDLSTPYPFTPSPSTLMGTTSTYLTETQTTTQATMSSVVKMEDYLEEEEGWRDNGRDEWDNRTNRSGANSGKYGWQVNGREKWGNGMNGGRDNGQNYSRRDEWRRYFNGREDWNSHSFDSRSLDKKKKTPYHYIPPIPADAKLTMSFPKTRQARRSTSALFSASSSASYKSKCTEVPASGPWKTKDNASPPSSSPESWKTASAAVTSSLTSDSWKTAEFATPASTSLWKTKITTSLSSLWKKALGLNSDTSSASAGSCTTSQGLDGDTPASDYWETCEEFAEGSWKRESRTSRSSSSGDDSNNPNRSDLIHSTTDSPLAAPCTTPQEVRAGRDDVSATLEVLVAAIHKLPSLQQPRQQQYENIMDHITQ